MRRFRDRVFLAGNHDVPAFNYVVPNMCEDGHDNCKPTGNPITQFDDFLAREVPIITTAYPDALVMVTYDEARAAAPITGRSSAAATSCSR
jgi:phosphatidylinositol-3-phosphatase